MQRYFLPPEQFHLTTQTVTIEGDDAHHLARVMRAEIGDKVICSNGVDREVLVRIAELDKGRVTAEIVEELTMDAEAAVQVWIAQSLPKGDKMEVIIQKGTEIGAARFLPFLSDRTIVQYDAKKEAKRSERWQKIAKEAAEQAHRNRVPQVESVHSWKQLLQRAKEADVAWICYEKEDGQQLRPAIQQALAQGKLGPGQQVVIAVGPEGGFTEQEIVQAEEAGFQSVSLGSRILRTETAAMVGLTCLFYETGEMGG
ncbi:ribosomal RNA small subunit methyltransferase E [Paenibacillus marchantiophytorum]|uniref:Ribosomal RNA small subunit methyltransferase E n=1 Tax=Paenibacillus marchantiophytorum TaxID=1619310 RepID=A0ABQ2BQC0_9BACL|nr:16S rRNA (uracil(1498)-N(3))-methyltransferase [Paenibacillus marchantiophytorum]GGI43514.1 ribosomal RNA small subunit methyltransferase E [Paenibacillus marchantiophytorum]